MISWGWKQLRSPPPVSGQTNVLHSHTGVRVSSRWGGRGPQQKGRRSSRGEVAQKAASAAIHGPGDSAATPRNKEPKNRRCRVLSLPIKRGCVPSLPFHSGRTLSPSPALRPPLSPVDLHLTSSRHREVVSWFLKEHRLPASLPSYTRAPLTRNSSMQCD